MFEGESYLFLVLEGKGRDFEEIPCSKIVNKDCLYLMGTRVLSRSSKS